jgi:hypothetical protein
LRAYWGSCDDSRIYEGNERSRESINAEYTEGRRGARKKLLST